MVLTKKMLLINSDDRMSPSTSTSTNFRYSFQQRQEGVVFTNLKQAQIGNGYNFRNAGTSTVTVGGSATTFTIQPGYYDDALLCDTIATFFNQINTIPNSTFFAEVTSQGFLQVINNVSASFSWTMTDATTALLLGFQNSATVTPGESEGAPYVLQSQRPIKIPASTFLLLQSDTLGNNISTRRGFSAWESIPNITPPGSADIMFYDMTSPSVDALYIPKVIEWIDIRLIDGQGQDVTTSNNIQLLVELWISNF